MNLPPFLTGQLLLALPGIGDPRFEHAVIALCAHDEEGALGIGIGKVVDGIGFHDLLRQFEIDPAHAPDCPILLGGPVETQRGFILHSRDWGGQDSLQVASGWVLSGTIDVLRAIAEGRGPTHWMAALGYAGWGPGQLENEMKGHGWFVTPATDHLLFDVAPHHRWERAYAEAGVDSSLIAPITGQA